MWSVPTWKRSLCFHSISQYCNQHFPGRCHFSKKYRTEDLPSSLLPDHAVIQKALSHTGGSKDHWLSHPCIAAKTHFLHLVIKQWEIPESPCCLSLSLLKLRKMWARCLHAALQSSWYACCPEQVAKLWQTSAFKEVVGLDGDGRCTSISPTSRARVLYCRFFKSCSGTF